MMLCAQFSEVWQAREWRKEKGGWLFSGTNRDGAAVVAWFSHPMTPTDVMLHPLTAGWTGTIF